MRTKCWIKIQRVGNDDKKGQRVHERNSAMIAVLRIRPSVIFSTNPKPRF